MRSQDLRNFWQLKALERSWKCFLFYLNKLNFLLENQSLLKLCIFISSNALLFVEVLVIKRWFPFTFAKILQGRHFVVGGPKNFHVSFDTRHQNIVFWVYWYFRVLFIKLIYTIFNEMKKQLRRPVISTIVDPYTSIFKIW